MSNIEFFAKINPRPFISLAKEERIRLEEIKKRLHKEKSGINISDESEKEITYERDVQEGC